LRAIVVGKLIENGAVQRLRRFSVAIFSMLRGLGKGLVYSHLHRLPDGMGFI
jgi:hypothetical protein